ncbi:MAG: hypothetical protein H0V17_33205 [Deltaproteobacteria bacterium]|nr:hypothetical protein [Deltaproteobacteria bacterium]
MKPLSVALVLSLFGRSAYAEDPMPKEDPVTDSPGLPGENEPVTSPAPAPVAPRARLPMVNKRMVNRAPRVTDDGESKLDKAEDRVEGGKHWRIKTTQGAVHVWVPPGYDRETAGTVIYVHGYWTDVDGAWREHQLAKQFRMSRQNALFIVPEAPASNEDNVKWPALTDLRKAMARANIKMPDGPIVVMGHSGAFRTVMQWVDHKLVDQIILLDAMYAGEKAFDEFIKSGKRADEHKMIVVGASVARASVGFAQQYKFAVARERFPETLGGFTKGERRAKLLYVRSQYDHMAIVTSRKVIPLLLRVTRLKPL